MNVNKVTHAVFFIYTAQLSLALKFLRI